jgi:hypothetical protein
LVNTFVIGGAAAEQGHVRQDAGDADEQILLAARRGVEEQHRRAAWPQRRRRSAPGGDRVGTDGRAAAGEAYAFAAEQHDADGAAGADGHAAGAEDAERGGHPMQRRLGKALAHRRVDAGRVMLDGRRQEHEARVAAPEPVVRDAQRFGHRLSGGGFGADADAGLELTHLASSGSPSADAPQLLDLAHAQDGRERVDDFAQRLLFIVALRGVFAHGDAAQHDEARDDEGALVLLEIAHNPIDRPGHD